MKLEKSSSAHHYFVSGTGEPLILLHGFPDCAENYFHQLEFFSSKGFQVFAPFMPGYHPEDAELDTYQSLRISEEIIKFSQSVTDRRINLVGHDWGAAVAYMIAGLAPELVNKLIAVSVPHGPSLGESFIADGDQQRKSWYMFFFQLPMADLAVPTNNFSFIDRLWTEWSPNWSEYKGYCDKAIGILSQENVLSKALAYYRSTFQPSLQSDRVNQMQAKIGVNKILPPTLYLHGENDGCIAANLSEGMGAHFENLEIKILPDCGHFLHLEKPDEVNKIILDFLSD